MVPLFYSKSYLTISMIDEKSSQAIESTHWSSTFIKKWIMRNSNFIYLLAYINYLGCVYVSSVDFISLNNLIKYFFLQIFSYLSIEFFLNNKHLISWINFFMSCLSTSWTRGINIALNTLLKSGYLCIMYSSQHIKKCLNSHLNSTVYSDQWFFYTNVYLYNPQEPFKVECYDEKSSQTISFIKCSSTFI